VNSLIDQPVEGMRKWFVGGMKELVKFANGSGVEIILENQVYPVLPTVAILPFRALSMEANDSTLGDWLAE
jgi:hypothetical protein